MLRNKISALFHPEQYHGWGKNKQYFEGWYYKVVNAAQDKAFAFIPGIAMDENGEQQAFVQVLDGIRMTADYHKYAATDFVPTPRKFEVQLAGNYFTTNKIQLDLPDVKGELTFHNTSPWSNEWYSPNIMGPFSFVPFMQCYHGILSMYHTISGTLEIKGETVNFDDGVGYMEKDWGRSFPEAYIWMQCNHFSKPNISIKSSVAKIPWLASSFVGFIAGVWLEDRLIEFTTYNFTRLRKSIATEKTVELVYENGKHRLEILAHRAKGTGLASPIQGFMDGRIEESMQSRMEVQLYDKKQKRYLLEDTGVNTALEVAGKIELITKL